MAINILFSDDELQSALDTIVESYNLGVDAFILQDIGLAKLVNEKFPQIELHASTQMGLHNLEGVKEIEKFGFKRVVLARETPLEEVRRIKQNSNLEIEYFAQGALCVSFSGNCYLSSYLCNASGNRGRCKQLCRLPYTFEKDGEQIKSGYLLSAKDLNMTGKLEDMKNAGVDVIKIEGRARRPSYVAIATKEYYNAVHGQRANLDNLRLAFNRDYTAGYFEGNGNIISDYHNHIGIFVGRVEKVVRGKTFDEVYFNSNRQLYPKSTFKIFSNNREKNTLTAFDLKEISREKYRLTTTQRVGIGDKIHLILDSKLETEILSQVKKKEIAITISAKENMPIKAKINLKNKEVEVVGDICEKANRQPISKKDFEENFRKNDIFSAKIEIESLDNIFMPKQKLNEFRRNVYACAFETLVKSDRAPLKKVKIKIDYKPKLFEDFQIVESLEEQFVATNIVYSPSLYNKSDIQEFQRKCRRENKNAFLDTPNFALEKDLELLRDIIENTKISIVANNYYALGFDTEIVIGAGLNIYNAISAQVYDRQTIVAESNISTKINFPYMTLRHCPLKSHLGANCSACPYRDGYTYKMDNGKILRLKRKRLSSCTFYLT